MLWSSWLGTHLRMSWLEQYLKSPGHPNRKIHLRHEIIFIGLGTKWRGFANGEVIYDIGKPRESDYEHLKKLLVRKWVLDLKSVTRIWQYKQESWSTTTISHPFLSLISKSNSCKSRIHLINLGLASFFVCKYLNAAWSENMTTLAPRIYRTKKFPKQRLPLAIPS